MRVADKRRWTGAAAARRVQQLLVLCLLAALAVVVASSAALAHPALIETTPGAGYAVTSPPESISVTFNEPVTPVGDALTLRLTDGPAIPVKALLSESGRSLKGVPDETLDAGSYEVSYRVVALDGDLIEGTFPFGVATPVAADSGAGGLSQDDPDEVQPGSALPRALLFLGLSLALGGMAAALIACREAGKIPAPAPLTRTGAALGLAGAGVLLLQIASLNVARLPTMLQSSEPARLLAAEAALFTVAVLAARAPLRGAVAAVALGLVVLLEGVRAHPGEAVGSAGVALTVVHLAAAAVWLGGLVHVVRLAFAWRGKSLATWVIVGAYARLALALFLLVLATGTLSALLLLPTREDLTGTTYGQVLLVKLALFTAAAVAAIVARTRHRRGAERDRDVVDRKAGTPWVLSRAARVEAALLVGVVVVTAGLTSATPPRLVSQTSLLTAPTGAVVRAAERINQVSVSLVASDGRLEAHAFAPDAQKDVEYDLDVTINPSRGAGDRLELDSCGESCWTAAVEWADGVNVVGLDVTASGWEGGQAEVSIAWPPEPANDLLRRVQTVMGAQSQITATESVTSGFGAAPTTVSTRTGQEYLADEPWAEGGVTDPVVRTDGAGVRTLLFAMPVLGYHFAFTLDDQDRVSRARIVTRNHLLERRYEYPTHTPGRR
jgi:copper transport protein